MLQLIWNESVLKRYVLCLLICEKLSKTLAKTSVVCRFGVLVMEKLSTPHSFFDVNKIPLKSNHVMPYFSKSVFRSP